jgi:sulfur carrier protein
MSLNSQVSIELNGEARHLPDVMSIPQFIEHEQIPGKRFVVVINDEIIPKTQWDNTQIATGDRVDIVSPISGG